MNLLRPVVTFTLLLAISTITGCGGGGSTPVLVGVSGTVTFDSVPTSISSGLVYASTVKKPVRGVVVEAINASDAVITSTVTDGSGAYSMPIPSNNSVRIRVKAQLKSAAFDFQVVDNTSSKALYVMDSIAFNTGVSNQTKNLNAASGWGGSSYTSTRAAAPFAILDTVYKCLSKVVAADSSAVFPPLQINWSVNNIAVLPQDIPNGSIGTSYYDPDTNALYILGKADNDSDEYDDHVIAHEWGHYFEANFSRSDSIGGSHGFGDKLDPRVAFGEGWGNAFSGMATDDKDYVDTNDLHQGHVGVHLDLSDANGDTNSIGWYSEDSIQYILYSLYKNIGFTPIYSVLINDEKTANSFTSIYSFSAFLKSRNSAHATILNPLLTSKRISASAVDQWDSSATETNDGGTSASLPTYVRLLAATPKSLSVGDQAGTYNKMLNRRFFVFTIPAGNTKLNTILVDRSISSRPALILNSNGINLKSLEATSSGVSSVNFMLGTLAAGTYYGEVFENSGVTGSIPFTLTLN